MGYLPAMPIMVNEERAKTIMGFEVGPFIKQIKKELGIINPVLLNFEGDVTKAHVDWKTGKCAIGLPTVGAIQRGLNLDPISVVAKQKAGLIEELCFAPDTVILTEERAKPIFEVEEGDRLYKRTTLITQGANQKQYLQAGFSGYRVKMVRQYKGDMVAIKPSHFLPIRCTPNHRFLVRRVFAKGKKQWVRADHLKVGDYFFFPLSNLIKARELPELPTLRDRWGHDEVKLAWSEDLARFLGYYLAEGFTAKRWIILSIGSHETDFLEDILRIIRTVFHRKAWIRPQIGEKCINVIFSCRDLAQWLHETFGSPANRKTFPTAFLSLPENLLRSFLWGYFRGDGMVRKHGAGWEQILVTASKPLAVMVQLALLRLGLISRISTSSRIGMGMKGRTDQKKHVWYDIRFPLKQGERKLAREIRLRHNYLLTRIDRLEKEPYDGPVYNFEMAGLPNYAVFPSIAHNCHCFHKEVTHNDKVVGCTVQKINEHLTPEERSTPYIKEKIEFLERSREQIVSVPL